MVVAIAKRHKAVLIRVSSTEQEHRGQIDNVKQMLKEHEVSVPEKYWFTFTVSRSKVTGNKDFQRMMEMVKTGQIETVYVESQDRLGGKNVKKFFALADFFSEHDTILYSLRDQRDLTASDDASEFHGFINAAKSKKEREDTAYRSLRTRLSNFRDTGTWPAGAQPFGYGKACYGADGALKWEWHPISRTMGQRYAPDPVSRKIVPVDAIEKIKRKDGSDIIKLVPHRNKEFVKTIQLLFDFYVRLGLSRRQISKRLNELKRTYYDKPFSHTLVTQILTNPAYAGDTHFGKTRTGELYTFDDQNIIVPMKKGDVTLRRPVEQRLIKQNTHKGIIDRKTWDMAQAKMKSERERVSYSPQNPAYYLKPILVCGHCGKNMTGQTDRGLVRYVCSTYICGKSAGRNVKCGFHTIKHDDAEKLLLDKLAEMKVEYEELASTTARETLRQRYRQLDEQDHANREQWYELLCDGVDTLLPYLKESLGLRGRELVRVEKLAMQFYRWGGKVPRTALGDFRVEMADFKKAIKAAEAAYVKMAKHKVEELKTEHAIGTRKWNKAEHAISTHNGNTATHRQLQVLKEDCDRLEAELAVWEPRAVPLAERLNSLFDASLAIQKQHGELMKEWPTLEGREKGESLRRIFKTVTLFWDAEFVAREDNPSRPHRTERPGRYQYTLRHDRTQWALVPCNLARSW